jgi:hypothetical protein
MAWLRPYDEAKLVQPANIGQFAGSSRFLVRARIGEGALGVVYESLDRERNTPVAIKTLRNPSAETIHSFKREFRALQDLQHPNLVSLGELFEERGTWFFTMELVQGVNLLRYVRPGSRESRASLLPPASGKMQRADTGRLDESRLRSALGQLARGLGALHAAHKVHRDIKPSNVLVTPEGRVVILDFGLVADALRGLSRSDEGMQGTVPYMAPEQAASETVSFAADWYAVGVILYQALTGRLPFYGTAGEVLEDKLTREPPAPHELVADVPADLDALCVQLLRMDPQQRPTDAQVFKLLHVIGDEYDSGSMRTPIFVGRQAEQDALREAFADVQKGGAVTVFVHGESGVGKSFLVRRFTDDLVREHPKTMVLTGRCYERESVAYKAVDGIVDALSEFLRERPDEEVKALLPPSVGLLEKAFPVLGEVPAIAAARSGAVSVASPEQLRAYTFAALRGLLDALARRQPLVLAIDDLQWADHDSLALLAEIMRVPAPPPLLLVATLRLTTESHRAVGATSAAPRIGGDVRHLHLDHLSNEEAERLVAGLLERLPHGDELRPSIGSIVADTQGHPLFIDEIVRQGAGRVEPGSGPLRLDEALWARIGRLDPSERRILEAVATAGLPIAQNVAAQAAATDPGDLFRIVSRLRAEHFVRTSGAGQKDSIEPYHDRIREVVTARLEPAARKDWHGRLALALEGQSDADPESLSTHWEGAGRPDRARHYALAAAERAEQTLAFDLAARLYRRALELSGGADARTAIEGRLAEALTNAGCWAEAADIRLELAGRADPTSALDLRRLAAEQLMCSGHFDRGVRILREALAECRVGDPQSPLGLLVALVFHRLLLALRGLAYRERQPTERDRPQLVRADTVSSAGAGFSMTDNIRGAYFQTRNLRMVLRAGDPSRIARALCMEVCFSSAGGPARVPRTRRLLASARSLADRLGTGEALGMAATAAGYMHYFVAEWSQAAQWLARAEEHFRDGCVGLTFELNSVRMMLYRALAFRGELREVAARVPAVYREANEHGDLYTRISLRAGPMTLMSLLDDEPARISDELADVEEWLPKTRFLVQHYWFMLGRSQVDLYEGNGPAAHQVVERRWAALARSLLLRVTVARIIAVEHRSRCALAAAAASKDERLLAMASHHARAIRNVPLAWPRGSASLLLGGIEAVRGRQDSAREYLEEAVRSFDQADMKLYRAVAQRRLGQLLGGDEGRELVAASETWMNEQGARVPAKLARVIAPGFGE